MFEKAIIITNNKLACDFFMPSLNVIFVDGTLMDVLKLVRDKIHNGHRLLTHPLMGSIKPNQTPYKTVVISRVSDNNVDVDSLMYIENSIETAEKLIRSKPPRDWPETVLNDFAVIDLDLIKNAINK